MKRPTKRQLEIFEYIRSYMQRHGHTPSYRQIGQHFQLQSTASVFKHVKALQKKGILVEENWKETQEKFASGLIELPLLGMLLGSQGVQTLTQLEKVKIPASYVPHAQKSYLLKMQGDTFQLEEQILDGDLLIVEERLNVFDGETALLCVNRQDYMIKRYYQVDGKIRLQSANSSYQPLYLRAESIEIKGVLAGLIRVY